MQHLTGGGELVDITDRLSPSECSEATRNCLRGETLKNLHPVHLQCKQAREQNFFLSEFEPILAHKIKSIIDKSLKLGTNLLKLKLYIEFKLWDVIVIISIFMAS